MHMEFNLRRASVVQNALRQAISEHAEKLQGSQNVEIWRFSQGPGVVEAHRDLQMSIMETLFRLNGILANIRNQVSQVNAVNGVNRLLGEQAMVQAQISQINRVARCEPALDWAVITEQVKHVVNMNGKNGYFAENAVAVNVFSQQDIDKFRSQLVALRRRLNDISDALVAANVKSTISLASEEWQWLESQGVV